MQINENRDVRLDAKLGRIIIDGLNRDAGVLQTFKALARFFRTDYVVTRRLSRMRRANILSRDLSPDETFALFAKYKLDPVSHGITMMREFRQSGEVMSAVRYARLLMGRELTASQSKFVAFTLFDGGDVIGAGDMLFSVDEQSLSPSEQQRRRRILSERRCLQATDLDDIFVPIVERLKSRLDLNEVTPLSALKFRMAYVAASSLPVNQVGYTTRTHRIVSGMIKAAGVAGKQDAIIAITRPGFPADRFDLKDVKQPEGNVSVVDNVTYHHIENSVAMQDDLLAFAETAAAGLCDKFVSEGVTTVMAASNHVNALCALLAARALGLPFVYELRGLWEETTESKKPGWSETERFRVERLLETFVVANSERTFFITRQVKELFFPNAGAHVRPGKLGVAARGEAGADLAPNCADIDPDRLDAQPIPSGSTKQQLTLTYIGSLVEYEGLQLILEAIAGSPSLRQKFKVNIVGAGNFNASLKRLADTLQLRGNVHFAGRVGPDEVSDWFEGADIILVPRMPYRVCQLVSPLKPLEAMASHRVCFASDVAPLADLIVDGETGFLFEAGNVESAQAALERVFACQPEHSQIAQRAFEYVAQHRNWDTLTAKLVTCGIDLADTGRDRAQRAIENVQLENMGNDYG